jgi:primosomal protein N'
MQQVGRSMKDNPQIELPNSDELREIGNRLMNEEMNYDIDIQRDEHKRILRTLNNEQKIAFNTVMESVDKKRRKLIFIEGHGGTSKTYVWKAIMTKIRSEGKIVLAVSLLFYLKGAGHHIPDFISPLNTIDESTCDI